MSNNNHIAFVERGLGISLFFLLVVALPSALEAQTLFNWSNAAGGSWQAGGNWAPSGPPTADDDAAFSLGNTYTVVSGSNAALRSMSLSAGNVTLNLGSTTLQTNSINVSGGKLTVPSLVRGTAGAGQVGFSSALNFTNGTLHVAGGPFQPTLGADSLLINGAFNTTARPTLHLTDGATTTLGGTAQAQGSIRIGIDGGLGSVLVSGQGTLLKAGALGGLSVGTGAFVSTSFRYGEGLLEIADGGQVSVANSSVIGSNGGVGRVTVDGAGSSLSVTPSSNAWLYVGAGIVGNRQGDGKLTLTNGGKASGASGVLVGNGAIGEVVVDGAGSALSTPANAFIGLSANASRGSGTLLVANGGNVTATQTVRIGDTGAGVAAVDGVGSSIVGVNGVYVGTSLYTSGSSIFRGDGTLSVTDGGQVVGVNGAVHVGALGGVRGVLNVGKSDGTDAGGTKVSAPTLNVWQNGSSVAEGSSTVNIHTGGSIELTSQLNTHVNPAVPDSTRVNLAGGTIKTPVLNMQEAAHLNWTSGTLWLTGGNSTTNGALAVPVDGMLKGSGTISGSVANTGTISPGDGNSIASFHLNDGLTIGTSETLGTFAADIEFAASTADLLNVSGAVNLANAELSLSLLNVPVGITTPLTFLLITNDGVDPLAGTFASIDLGVSSSFQYSINYAFSGAALNGVGDGNDVAITFTAVPEPGSISLMAIAGLGWAAFSWRRSMVR